MVVVIFTNKTDTNMLHWQDKTQHNPVQTSWILKWIKFLLLYHFCMSCKIYEIILIWPQRIAKLYGIIFKFDINYKKKLTFAWFLHSSLKNFCVFIPPTLWPAYIFVWLPSRFTSVCWNLSIYTHTHFGPQWLWLIHLHM